MTAYIDTIIAIVLIAACMVWIWKSVTGDDD